MSFASIKSKIATTSKYLLAAVLGFFGGNFIHDTVKHGVENVNLGTGDLISDTKNLEMVRAVPASKVKFSTLDNGTLSLHEEATVTSAGNAFDVTQEKVTQNAVPKHVVLLSIAYNEAGAEVSRTVCRPAFFPNNPQKCDLFLNLK